MLNIFGKVEAPQGVRTYGELTNGSGLITFLGNLLLFIRVIAGIYALINLILAGLEYIGSDGDPKKTSQAWQKIYMSGLGLLVIVASFVIAAIIGYMFFGEWRSILMPEIYGPGE